MTDAHLKQALCNFFGSSDGYDALLANVFSKTERGSVKVSDEFIMGATAEKLREDGFIVSDKVPDHAVVRHMPNIGGVFCWKIQSSSK